MRTALFALIATAGFAFIGDLSPAYYLTVVCILSFWAMITIRTTSADASY